MMSRRMFLSLSLLSLLFVLLPQETRCYSAGAPPSTCDSMRPSHGSVMRIRKSNQPFTVTVSGDGTYEPGQTYDVLLQSSDGSKDFRGFFLQARKASTESGTVGTFSSQKWDHGTQCDGGALTHNASRRKKRVDTKWTAPTEPQGDIVFVATVVEEYQQVWMDISSSVIREHQEPDVTAMGQTTEEIPSTPLSPSATNSSHCSDTVLQPLPAATPLSYPQVAVLCNSDAQCPCSWRCCTKCDDVTGKCVGHAICRQPRENDPDSGEDSDEDSAEDEL